MNIDLNTLTSDQIAELEKLIEYNKKADKIVKDFYEYVTLNMKGFKNGNFMIYNDNYNKQYLTIEKGIPVVHCRFLHESYDIVIEKDIILQYLKDNYRGLSHVISMIDVARRDRGSVSGN